QELREDYLGVPRRVNGSLRLAERTAGVAGR
ncbi:MAG: hypothetical protein JWR35_3436, partial [Marmoricola sp.]|nr:hypothetical protein [Marmoricola sp.]